VQSWKNWLIGKYCLRWNTEVFNFKSTATQSDEWIVVRCTKCWAADIAGFCRIVKVTLVQALRLCTGRTARRGGGGIAVLFHDHGTRRGWEVSVTPRPLFTSGKDTVPIYRRLGVPQGRSGQVRKILPPPGFDPQTVQPVARRYTNWATLTFLSDCTCRKIRMCFLRSVEICNLETKVPAAIGKVAEFPLTGDVEWTPLKMSSNALL